MNMHRTRHALGFALGAAVAFSAGCASVDHVNTYRDARAIYNDATGSANDISSSNTRSGGGLDSPSDNTWAKPDAALTSGFTGDQYLDLHARYTEAAILLRAINENPDTKSALKKDQLYGASATLQLLAEWKAAFYARLLDIETPSESDAETLPQTQTMLDLRQRGKDLVTELEGVEAAVFPRDQFLLAAFGPLLRYDNAYIYAAEASKAGRFDVNARESDANRLADVKAVVEEMARAEEELASLMQPDGYEEHLVLASVAAREMMLRTGVAIVNQAQLGTWDYAKAASELPRLTRRVRAFAEGATTAGDPVNRFLIRLGEDLTGTNANRDAVQLVGRYWAGNFPDG